jgi:hypothetical protein
MNGGSLLPLDPVRRGNLAGGRTGTHPWVGRAYAEQTTAP